MCKSANDFLNARRILKNSRIKSPPFSREDLGGLFVSCEQNVQICKWFLK